MAFARVQKASNSQVGPGPNTCPVILGGEVAAIASASQTVAAPGVFTTATQAFTAGMPVFLTGTAPGGFALNTVYWVIAAGLTTTSCELAATQGGTGITCSASAACTINPTVIHTAGNTGILINRMNPALVSSITDTAGNTWSPGPGAGKAGIFGFGLFLHFCQNLLAGANIITGHTNGTTDEAIAFFEFSGLATSGGALGANYNAQNGPGAGADAVTSNGFLVGAVPALVFGFGVDFSGSSFFPTAGTNFSGQGGMWSNYGTDAQAEDRRELVGGSFAATYSPAAHTGDVFAALGVAFAELGAVPITGGTGTGGPPGGKWSWMKRR